jgi:predicted alpha/beta-hydrolase family hydrolase
LPKLKSPALFVHGTSDPFGAIPEIEAAMKLIPAKTALLQVENAGHDLGFKGETKQADLPDRVLTEFRRLVA